MLLIGAFFFSGCEKDASIKVDNLADISGYPVVGTNQSTFFNNITIISAPSTRKDFYGQNAISLY